MSPFGPQVLELQDCVSRLQTLNNELQDRLSLLEKSDHDSYDKADKDVASCSPWKQVSTKKQQQQTKEDVLEVKMSTFIFQTIQERAFLSCFQSLCSLSTVSKYSMNHV